MHKEGGTEKLSTGLSNRGKNQYANMVTYLYAKQTNTPYQSQENTNGNAPAPNTF